MSRDDLPLLTLHGLRLAGLASVAEVADIHDLEPSAVAEELERLTVDGLVAPARGGVGRFTLTEAGRRHGEELLARELASATTDGGVSGSSTVHGIYERFLDLNQSMLDVCTTWQVVSTDPIVLNDHSDLDYDAAVIAAVGEIDARIQPMCAELESVSARFGRYGPGFSEALHRLRQGANDWLTKPTILSYHTLWFQLHEDLLATLGLERAAETARLTANRQSTDHDSPPASTGHTSRGNDSP